MISAISSEINWIRISKLEEGKIQFLLKEKKIHINKSTTEFEGIFGTFSLVMMAGQTTVKTIKDEKLVFSTLEIKSIKILGQNQAYITI